MRRILGLRGLCEEGVGWLVFMTESMNFYGLDVFDDDTLTSFWSVPTPAINVAVVLRSRSIWLGRVLLFR